MSAKSKSSRKAKAVDRPFSLEIQRRAGELVPLYQVIVRWDPENACFAGQCIELPNAVGFAETESACVAEVRGNADALVCVMLERGEIPPLDEEPERTNQINVRFADYEKAAAEALAAAEGLSLSEHVRRAALRPA
jgi:predicted HicB family RNase H-like nuclease